MLSFDFILPSHDSGTVIPMLEAVLDVVPVDKLAVHFHDTYGQALSNILASLLVSVILHVFLKEKNHGRLLTPTVMF